MNDIERLKDIIQCYKNNPMTNYNKEIVVLAEEKIQSLQEKQKRKKGCEYCNSEYSKMFNEDSYEYSGIGIEYLSGGYLRSRSYTETSFDRQDAVKINFCPMCGRRLEELK